MDQRLRQCISCRKLRPRDTLIRLTCDRQGHFSIDNNPSLQGRSAYVCRTNACLSDALKAKKFQRTLKRGIPDVIVETLNVHLKGLNPQ